MAGVTDTASTPPPGWKPQSEFSDLLRQRFSPAELKAPVSWGTLIDFLGMIVDGNAKAFERVVELQTKVETLSDQPVLKYLGVWSASKTYGSGCFTTDHGSMWYALRASIGERPGTGDSWQLAVKKGRDAR